MQANLDHSHLGVLTTATEEARGLDAEIANLRRQLNVSSAPKQPAQNARLFNAAVHHRGRVLQLCLITLGFGRLLLLQ